jgi:hypothetical protein
LRALRRQRLSRQFDWADGEACAGAWWRFLMAGDEQSGEEQRGEAHRGISGA